MNHLSLFSGIGGLDLGLDRAGMTTVGQVEKDEFCRKVLAKHWPEVPKHDDVKTFAPWWESAPRPTVDLVAGGFPCQGHSVAGLQLGIDDPRWGWPWFRDVIDHLTETQETPPVVLIENVPNLLRTGFEHVLRDLAERGFDAWWTRLPAAAVGAPHLRWRLLTVAAHPGRFDGRAWGAWGAVGDRADGSVVAPSQLVTGWDGAVWSLGDTLRPGWRTRPGMGPSTGAAPVGTGGWPAEPDVGRVAYGVPSRVDRLRGLGNAVVPAVGEWAGRMILDTFG